MHQALYRKYRPTTFSDVCGEDHVASVLQYEAKIGKISHAYLFCGPRGTGKTSCAKILAKAVNCEHPVDGNPCGECFSCKSIDAGSATDVLEMDAASNNGVEYIRDIREEVNFTPASLKRRVYIIDEVHMLSQSAFNALLKTLEEPPAHVLFILATTELHKLPATIISRCQRFDFRRISVDVLSNRLLYISKEEKMPLEEDAAKLLAKQAQGGMRDAISLFELCGSGGQPVTLERVRSVLGLSGIEAVYKTAVAVSREDIASLFQLVSTVVDSSKDIAVFWQELTAFWRDMLIAVTLKDKIASYLDLTEPEMRLLLDASRRFTKAQLSMQFSILDDALREMTRLPQNKRVTAEISLIRMSDPKLCKTTESIIARLTSLEDQVALLKTTSAVKVQQVTEIDTDDFADSAETASDTEMQNDTNIAQKATSPRTEKASTEGQLEPIADISEIAEKLSQMEPMCAAFFNDADCFISRNMDRILVKATSDFAVQMLTKSKEALLSAFRVCGFGTSTTNLDILSGATPKIKKNPVDEIAEF